MMRLRNTAGLLALAVAVTACASATERPYSALRGESLAASRGRGIAEIRCAGCHAISSFAESPREGAPSFGQVRLRYNALSWHRVMREIGEGRHGEMPPIKLNESEVEDLRAYVETNR